MTKNVVGIALIVIGVAYTIMASQIPSRALPGDPGPSIIPMGAGIFLVILSVLLIVRNLRRLEERVNVAKKTLFMILLTILYILFLKYSFTLMTMLYSIVGAFILKKSGEKIPKWTIILFSVIFSVSVYLIFGFLLDVSLPDPIMEILIER
ncbi:MAG: tripartite tricarboxylate transporter TctB family protein [Thermotogaceae bacterium]|nr:tripartite tricarboxylate transporter TctB family protein [Thermotogaceae bacterium]